MLVELVAARIEHHEWGAAVHFVHADGALLEARVGGLRPTYNK